MATAQTSPSDLEPNSLISITLIGFWASTIYRGHTHTAESPFKPSTRSLRDQHQTGRDHSVIRASARSPRRSWNTRAKGSDRRPAPRPLKLPRASTQREGWHCTGSAILPSLADSAQYRTRPALRLPISKKRNRRTCKRSGHPASRSDGLRMSSLQRVAPTRKPRDAQSRIRQYPIR